MGAWKLLPGTRLNATERKRAMLQVVTGISILAIIAAVLYFLPPSETKLFPGCPWHMLTGTYCPGCGSVRGVTEIVNGNLFGLWNQNPLAMVLAPIIIYAAIRKVVEAVAAYQMPAILTPQWVYVVLLIMILAYWVLRNFIPYLAPKP